MGDRRTISSLLGDLRQALDGMSIEDDALRVLELQADLIGFLVGRVNTLQMQVELLSRHETKH
jgi:hypothetical protein